MRAKVSKEAVLEKVFEIMLIKGYNGTGVREVMHAMNLHKGSFYNYFDSKEDMAMKALELYMKKMLDWADTALSNTDLNPLQRIELFHQVLIDHFRKELKFKGGCFVGNFSTELGDTNPQISKQLVAFFKQLHALLIDCIREGQVGKVIDVSLDPHTTAEFLTSAWQGAVLKMKNAQNAVPLENFMHMITKMLKYA